MAPVSPSMTGVSRGITAVGSLLGSRFVETRKGRLKSARKVCPVLSTDRRELVNDALDIRWMREDRLRNGGERAISFHQDRVRRQPSQERLGAHIPDHFDVDREQVTVFDDLLRGFAAAAVPVKDRPVGACSTNQVKYFLLSTARVQRKHFPLHP